MPHHELRSSDILGEVELFAGLSTGLRAGLASSGVHRMLHPGEQLWSQGERADSLVVLCQGTLRVFRCSPLGRRAVLNLVRAPDVLGDVAVFDGLPHFASVEAAATCALLSISRDVLVDALLRCPGTCQAVLSRLGAHVRRLTEQQTDFVFLDLPGRVAKTLLRLADGTTPPSAELNQTTLAQIVGGARQSVNEAVVQFVRRGWLHVEPGRFIILDFESLGRRAGLGPVACHPARPVDRPPPRPAPRGRRSAPGARNADMP